MTWYDKQQKNISLHQATSYSSAHNIFTSSFEFNVYKQSYTDRMSIYQYILLDVCGDESLTDFKPKFNAKHEKALFFIYLLYQLRKDTDFTPAS